MAMPNCPISQKCQDEAGWNMGEGPEKKPLNCADNMETESRFRCICAKSQFLGHNRYFSGFCVFQECTDPDARRAFMSGYKKGCEQLEMHLLDIDEDWAPFATSPAPTSTTEGATTQTTTPSSTSVAVTTLTQTSSMVSSTSSQATTSTSTATSLASPSTSLRLPDAQIPICGIPQRCMTEKPQGDAKCSPDDFTCICKASNSFEHNTEFDQQCVYNTCVGDIGKEEFLDSLIYHCTKVSTTLTDIPKKWEAFLPSTYLPPSPTSSSAPTPSSSNPAPTASPTKFGTGAIVGTALAALLALGLLAGLVKLYYDTKRKANRLKVYNAELQDATNPEGALRRINTLMSGHETPEDEGTATLGAAERSLRAVPSTYNGGGASTYIGGTTLIGSGVPPSRAGYPVYASQFQDLKEYDGRDGGSHHEYEAEDLAKYNALREYNSARERQELDDTRTRYRSPHHSPHHSPVYDNHTRSPHHSPVHSPVHGQSSPVYQQRSPIYDDAESDYRSQRAVRNWDEDETVVGGLGETRTVNDSYRDRGERDSWDDRYGK